MSTEGTKEPVRNWITFVLGNQIGTDWSEVDTYVAVLERAPQKNEEVMTVFTRCNVSRWVYLVFMDLGVGKAGGHHLHGGLQSQSVHFATTKVQNGHNSSRPSVKLSYVIITDATGKRVE